MKEKRGGDSVFDDGSLLAVEFDNGFGSSRSKFLDQECIVVLFNQKIQQISLDKDESDARKTEDTKMEISIYQQPVVFCPIGRVLLIRCALAWTIVDGP